MAPVTLQRFLRELDKLKQQTDAGRLQAQDYDGRLARIVRELRDLGLDADRAAATAALAHALERGVITTPFRAHVQERLGLARRRVPRYGATRGIPGDGRYSGGAS